MNNKLVLALLVIATLGALASVGAWYEARTGTHGSSGALASATLEPVAALLGENEALIKKLSAEPYAEPGVGILQSYIDEIRRDGVPKHAEMKQYLDALNDNNMAIVTLLKAYSAQAKTPQFTREADKFREYASAWHDRWDSVMDLFMAGGSYATSEVPAPAGFAAVVQAEIAAAK